MADDGSTIDTLWIACSDVRLNSPAVVPISEKRGALILRYPGPDMLQLENDLDIHIMDQPALKHFFVEVHGDCGWAGTVWNVIMEGNEQAPDIMGEIEPYRKIFAERRFKSRDEFEAYNRELQEANLRAVVERLFKKHNRADTPLVSSGYMHVPEKDHSKVYTLTVCDASNESYVRMAADSGIDLGTTYFVQLPELVEHSSIPECARCAVELFINNGLVSRVEVVGEGRSAERFAELLKNENFIKESRQAKELGLGEVVRVHNGRSRSVSTA